MNVGDRRDAVREEHRHLPVAQVHVTIDEARKDRSAIEPDDRCVRWIFDLLPRAHRLDARAFDEDDGVANGSATRAIDQRSAFKNENSVLRRRL